MYWTNYPGTHHNSDLEYTFSIDCRSQFKHFDVKNIMRMTSGVLLSFQRNCLSMISITGSSLAVAVLRVLIVEYTQILPRCLGCCLNLNEQSWSGTIDHLLIRYTAGQAHVVQAACKKKNLSSSPFVLSFSFFYSQNTAWTGQSEAVSSPWENGRHLIWSTCDGPC